MATRGGGDTLGQTITRVGFDLADKDLDDGNYKIETTLDNPTVASDRFVLGNQLGDNMGVDDANALTWKLEEQTWFTNQGGRSNVITSGVLRIEGAVGGFNGRQVKVPVSVGAFEEECVWPNYAFVTNSYFVIQNSSFDYCYVRPQLDGRFIGVILGNNISEKNVSTGVVFSPGDDVGCKCIRDGSNNITLQYNVNGGSWITITTQASSNFTESGKVTFVAVAASGGQTTDVSYYKTNVGALDAGAFRTSAAPVFSKDNADAVLSAGALALSSFTFDYHDFTAARYISGWDLKVGGVSKATIDYSGGDLTGSGTEVVTIPSTGDFADVTGVFTVHPIMVGGGAGSGAVSRIATEYTGTGWSGKVSSVINPSKILGVDTTNIAKFQGVSG